jgi:hypothetical protein
MAFKQTTYEHGVIQVRINRNGSFSEGFWHKRSKKFEYERVLSNMVASDGLMYQGYSVKSELTAGWTAEIRVNDELFLNLEEWFINQEPKLLQAGALLVTMPLSAEGSIGVLTIDGEEKKSWTFYPEAILDVEPAAREPQVVVKSQQELDNMLMETAEQSRKDRTKAISKLIANSRQQSQLASLGVDQVPTQPNTTETVTPDLAEMTA